MVHVTGPAGGDERGRTAIATWQIVSALGEGQPCHRSPGHRQGKDPDERRQAQEHHKGQHSDLQARSNGRSAIWKMMPVSRG
jgi:hypothetical protein